MKESDLGTALNTVLMEAQTMTQANTMRTWKNSGRSHWEAGSMVPVVSIVDQPVSMVCTLLGQAVKARTLEKWRWEKWRKAVKVLVGALKNWCHIFFPVKTHPLIFTFGVKLIAEMSRFAWVNIISFSFEIIGFLHCIYQ